MAVKYVLVIGDRADADRDRIALSYLRRDPNYFKQWEDGLISVLNDLTTGFPGPLSHARDENASDFYGREVRRLLYYGPTRRRTGIPARLLFTLLPPNPDEPEESAETVIFLLRLLHGAQTLTPEDPADG